MKIDLAKLKSATTFSGAGRVRKALEAAAKRNSSTLELGLVEKSIDLARATKAGEVIFRKSGSILDALGTAAEPNAKAAPSIPDDNDLAQLAAARGLEWKDGARDRVVAYWASDSRVDAHGDIVEQDWIFDEYAKNPVLLAQHDWSGDPIGAALQWAVKHRNDADYQGAALWMVQLFAEAEASARADSILRLVRAGIMRSCSVGFWSERIIDVMDPEERAQLGLGAWGWILAGNHLLELSPVSLPANPGAHVCAQLARAVESGEVKAADVELLRELARRSAPKDSRKTADDLWIGLERVLFPGQTFTAAADEENQGEPEPTTEPDVVPPPAWGDELASLRADVAQLRGELADARGVLLTELNSIHAIADDVRSACDRMTKNAVDGNAGDDENREGAGSASGDEDGNGAVGVSRSDASASDPEPTDLMRTLGGYDPKRIGKN